MCARVHAGATRGAAGEVDPPACPESDSSLRADLGATTRIRASLCEDGDLGSSPYGFRILTPEAAKKAALEEDRRANPGTVVQREPLNVRNQGFVDSKSIQRSPSSVHIFTVCRRRINQYFENLNLNFK
jgi:hypothetical protein